MTYLNDKFREGGPYYIEFDRYFNKITTLKDIIQCGIYDILVFEEDI